jgi:hypothetical protein
VWNTRWIFVEGIMGAGKSTAVYSLVTHLRREGISAQGVWEGPTLDEPDHSLRVAPTLPHPLSPWDELTAEQFAEESLGRWRRHVAGIVASESVTVCDGLLFHGNMTDLMLMGMPLADLRKYAGSVLTCLDALNPVLIYLRRPDIAGALRTIVEERGSQWQEYQTGWKLSSPLARRHGWQGFDGLIELYVSYRAVCDHIFQGLQVPKLVIDHEGNWDAVYVQIARFLDLPAGLIEVPLK